MEVGMIYRFSGNIHGVTNWKLSNVFLFLNTVFWSVLAFLVGVVGISLVAGTLIGNGITLFCIVGYTGVIVGFFGGTFYLYKKDDE